MIGRRDYEERKAARIARLGARAEKLRAEGATRVAGAERLAGFIPMGQPILIGHHSERRHRADLARIDNGYRKGFAALNEAKVLDRRASIAEENRAISSDDPDALDKLKAKLAKVEADRARYVLVNKALRKKTVEERKAGLLALGLSPEAADRAIEYADGIPGYKLTNMAAEARRLKDRITVLERAAATPEKEPEAFGEVRIEQGDNRVQMFFPGKPADAVRTTLKRHGFRWTPTLGAWTRMMSDDAWYWARSIAKGLATPGAAVA